MNFLLPPGQTPQDRHDIIARVFYLKVKASMSLLIKGALLAEVKCNMYIIKWQNRGPPHVHLLLWLQSKIMAEQIDHIIVLCRNFRSKKGSSSI